MVRPSELESPTPAMSRRYSNQLSYGRTMFLIFFMTIVTKSKAATLTKSNRRNGGSGRTRIADPYHVKVVL